VYSPERDSSLSLSLPLARLAVISQPLRERWPSPRLILSRVYPIALAKRGLSSATVIRSTFLSSTLPAQPPSSSRKGETARHRVLAAIFLTSSSIFYWPLLLYRSSQLAPRAIDPRRRSDGVLQDPGRRPLLDTRSNISGDRCKTKRSVHASARKRRICPRRSMYSMKLPKNEDGSWQPSSPPRCVTRSTVKSTANEATGSPSSSCLARSRALALSRSSLPGDVYDEKRAKWKDDDPPRCRRGFFHLPLAVELQEAKKRESSSRLFDVTSTLVLFPLGFSFRVVHPVVVAGPRLVARSSAR